MSTHYSKKTDIFPLSGGCACGLIRYQLSLPPLIVHCCWCTACQRQTGSVLALNALIESSAITILPSAPPCVAGCPSKPESIPANMMPVFARATSAKSTTTCGQPRPAVAETRAVCLPSQSGLGQTVVSCPACNTGLWNFYGDAGPHISYVRVGTLDKPWEIEPDVHIYTRSRQSFLAVNDGKPSFEEYYPKREELLREDALERFKALGAKIGGYRVELKAAFGETPSS
ncbi:hypothetical protein ACJ41O_002760 [Fusarium nematophilum]